MIDETLDRDRVTKLAQGELKQDAYSGHRFVFVSRRGDRVKVLTWDKGGFVLLYKRLAKGQFKLPHMNPSSMAFEFDATQLTTLLDGIDVGRGRRPEHWKPPSEEVAVGRFDRDLGTAMTWAPVSATIMPANALDAAPEGDDRSPSECRPRIECRGDPAPRASVTKSIARAGSAITQFSKRRDRSSSSAEVAFSTSATRCAGK